QNGQLYMQAFDVLEDDPRDWKKAQKKLIGRSVAATLQKQLKSHNEQVDWQVVSTLSHEPRGIPVPISESDATVDQVLAAAPKVQNRVPEGSTWDGTTDLPMDEATFRQVISEMEPPKPGAAPGAPGTKGDPALDRPKASEKTADPAPASPAATAPPEPPSSSTSHARGGPPQ